MRLFYDIVIYFALFSFCGWVCESVFCSVLERKPVNRGFLTGPFCPVYGFGGLLVVYVLVPFERNTPLLFLLGMIVCTMLEYVTSVVLEKLFETRWWDYKENRFNLNGRVCLSFSILFGGLAIVAVKLLYPPFYQLVGMISRHAAPVLALGIIVMFILDSSFTVLAVLRLNGKLAEIEGAMRELRAKLEEVSEHGRESLAQLIVPDKAGVDNARHAIEKAKERIQGMLLVRRFQERRLIQAFPTMRSLKYREQLATLRENLSELKEGRKK